MKLLVCGSRSWENYAVVYKKIHEVPNVKLIVHGGAFGADALAEKAAQELKIPTRVYRPNWEKYGRSAGFIRNAEMLEIEKPDLVLAFWDGESRGTKHMIDIARRHNFEVRII